MFYIEPYEKKNKQDYIGNQIAGLRKMDESDKGDGKVDGILFSIQIVFICVILVGQVVQDNRRDLRSVMLNGGEADVFYIIQICMIVFNICNGRKVKSRYVVFNDGKVCSIGHRIIHQIGQ